MGFSLSWSVGSTSTFLPDRLYVPRFSFLSTYQGHACDKIKVVSEAINQSELKANQKIDSVVIVAAYLLSLLQVFLCLFSMADFVTNRDNQAMPYLAGILLKRFVLFGIILLICHKYRKQITLPSGEPLYKYRQVDRVHFDYLFLITYTLTLMMLATMLGAVNPR